MIATKIMELRKRRGLMITLIVLDIGFPAVFYLIRLLGHAFAPRANPPAGSGQIFTFFAAGFLPTFGFIVAATVGCTAGSRDLTEGMFRHLVVTGRSRLALYLARIPAGLAIVASLVAIGYAIVCAVSVFAAPTFIDYNNVNIPPGLSRAEFGNWARDHAEPAGRGPRPPWSSRRWHASSRSADRARPAAPIPARQVRARAAGGDRFAAKPGEAPERAAIPVGQPSPGTSAGWSLRDSPWMIVRRQPCT
jgi:hypothetical protein